MASPQKENGFTPIAHELLRAIIRAKLPGQPLAALLVLALRSYGQSKKETMLSYAEIASEMGTNRPRAIEAIKHLVVRYIVLPPSGTVERTTGKNVYKIQKDYQQWGGTVERTSTVERTTSGTVERTTPRTRASLRKEKKRIYTHKPFVPPTPQEVEAYARTIGFEVNGDAFCAYYDASNWMRGRTKITRWKACVWTWKTKEEAQKVVQHG